MSPARRLWHRFRFKDDGTATIQFVIMIIPVMFIFTGAFEIAMFMSRQVMIERAVALASRELRLMDGADSVSANDIRDLICASTTVIDDCASNTRVEMVRIDTAEAFTDGQAAVNVNATCVNKDDPDSQDPEEVDSRSTKDIMLIRVCVLQDPIFPSTGIGAQLQKIGDQYAIVSLNAFTTEPK